MTKMRMTTLQKKILEELKIDCDYERISQKLDCSEVYVYRIGHNYLSVQTTEPVESTEPVKEKEILKIDIPKIKNLIGMEDVLNKIKICSFGSKPIFIGGFHGLGKSQLVTELAKHDNAKLIRLQVTPFLTEYDIVGQPDIKNGFILSKFALMLQEANENPGKQYYLLLDEFTRGQQEAFQCLMPVLAEKTLFINNPASDINSINISDNVKIFATGNLHDNNQRDIGQAEMDRWNIIEIQPIQTTSKLNTIIHKTIDFNMGEMDKLIDVYKKSWTKAGEGRILAMSIRTLIETARILKTYVKTGEDINSATKKALEITYYGTSQAVLNPLYKQTYNEILTEVFGYE